MKQKTLRSFLPRIAASLFLCLVAATALLLSSFRAQEKFTDDVWKMLGISKQTGDEKIHTSFMNGYLDYWGVRNLKNIATNNRPAIAKDLLTYTKTFVSSPAFKKDYDNMRKNSKPQEPELKPLRTIEEIQKEEIAKTEKSIRDTEKTMKEMPDMAKTMQPLVELFKKNLKDYQNPKNSYFAAIAAGEKNDQENQIKSHKERTKQWESAYPVDVNNFIAERLQRMLNATKDIDYSAQLVEKYGKKRFVNQAYEYKNQEWKQGFRAGKEVTEPARDFVQKWLNELK
jgi:hypothetical protein